jgi:Xaa-Pro dipeptidase
MSIDYSKWELNGPDMDIFKNNRTRYINNLKLRVTNLSKNGVLVLKGGVDIHRYDTDVVYYHFFQESNFFYLTGVRDINFWAVIDVNTGALDLFFKEESQDYNIWMKVMSKQEVADKYKINVENVHYNHELNGMLRARDPETIYILEGNNEYSDLPVYTADLNFEGEFGYLNDRVYHEALIYDVLCDTRSVKSPEEFGLLKFIADITNDAHKEIMKNIKPGMYERDPENIFNNYLSEKYYTRIWAYPCIGGCGHNSATLHYDKNDCVIKDGDFYLADMGIRFCNYTSDVTRTIPANGKFTKQQKEIYNIVLKANNAVIAIMKPVYTTYSMMDKTSRMVILEELQKLGLIKSGIPTDELFAAGVHKVFMPHGLGHLVGLDVHDVGSRVSYKSSRILEEGNFITVEPGVYFIEFVLENAFKNPNLNKYLNEQVIRTYMGLGGVRIEDDIYVTADGVINFQKDLPRTTEDIEAFMKKNNPNIK